MRKVVIFGATSAIASATAQLFAHAGDELLLVGRNELHLNSVKNDLITRGAQGVKILTSDLADCSNHPRLLQLINEVMPDFDTVFVAYGVLGDQKASEADFGAAVQELNTNFISVVSLLTPIANIFAERQSGTIAVISSVAGDRGRKSNYIYGTAKGALSIYLQGLRNRLAEKKVSVITIKPGFVDTPMTADLPKGILFASPQTVAKGIYKAICKKKDVVYLPFYWRYIMLIVKAVPEFIFKFQKII